MDLLLYCPERNPDGPSLEDVLEQLIVEIHRKQARARNAGRLKGTRESALVVTKLEEALLWQYRRGQATGVVEVVVRPLHPPLA